MEWSTAPCARARAPQRPTSALVAAPQAPRTKPQALRRRRQRAWIVRYQPRGGKHTAAALAAGCGSCRHAPARRAPRPAPARGRWHRGRACCAFAAATAAPAGKWRPRRSSISPWRTAPVADKAARACGPHVPCAPACPLTVSRAPCAASGHARTTLVCV